ncbi:Nicotinate-nucleotide adenylyltransferase [hydrothermal vent metagenome]|uniref:Nicotinate-nucleotide adenylyltransferase n=1 Tax=hydrothermal vent metagenome TaxID=652676 RepID=A0A3B0ZRW2_9ZZZZ
MKLSESDLNACLAPVAVMGGMFDPVHIGHLRSAIEVLEKFKFKELRLIPCAQPVHRQAAVASAEHRVTMLRYATNWSNKLVVDECEIQRTTPSYTVDTLRYLKKTTQNSPLCLIVGDDAFHGFPAWHQWQDLFSLANILVLQRPGVECALSDELNAALAGRTCVKHENLRRSPAGKVFFHSVTQLDISSTRIRALLSTRQNVNYLVPDTVINYIVENKLYRG